MNRRIDFLSKVLAHKGILSEPYLLELSINEEFDRSLERDFNTYQNANKGDKVSTTLIKAGDMKKLISFKKGDVDMLFIKPHKVNDIIEDSVGEHKSLDQWVEENRIKPGITKEDHGKHYRFQYITPLGENVQLDPYLVGKVWGMTSAPLQTVLKKIARSGKGGYKTYEQDIKDCISALERELELNNLGMGEK